MGSAPRARSLCIESEEDLATVVRALSSSVTAEIQRLQQLFNSFMEVQEILQEDNRCLRDRISAMVDEKKTFSPLLDEEAEIDLLQAQEEGADIETESHSCVVGTASARNTLAETVFTEKSSYLHPTSRHTSEPVHSCIAEGRPSLVLRIAKSRGFEIIVAVIILMNAFSVGVEAQGIVTKLSETTYRALRILENVFCFFFTFEICVRLKAFGMRYYDPRIPEHRKNTFDLCLVIFVGIIMTWLLPLAGYITQIEFGVEQSRAIGLLRCLRLLRMLEVLSGIPEFHEGWKLIRGLVDSTKMLFWTFVVVAFVVYLFAIFALVTWVPQLQDIHKSISDAGATSEELEGLDVVLEWTVGLDNIMISLIQILLGDGFSDNCRIIMKHVLWFPAYLYTYIGVSTFVLMNLVTAVIVENAMTKAANDAETMKREREVARMKQLREFCVLFKATDIDGNGKISWLEFESSFTDPATVSMWETLDIEPHECKDIFSLLDERGDGEVDMEEFFEGLIAMKGLAQAKHLYKVEKDISRIQGRLDKHLEITPVLRSEQRTPIVDWALSNTLSAGLQLQI